MRNPAFRQARFPLAADGLGAQLLLTVSDEIDAISREIGGVARTLTHFPAFYHWIVRTANDPAAYHLLIEIAWKLGASTARWCRSSARSAAPRPGAGRFSANSTAA